MSAPLADPLEGGPLVEDGPLLRSDAGTWPVLGGVPILVPDPARWLRGARDHVLAALGESGRLTRGDVELLDTFCGAVRGVAPADLEDDFLDGEEEAFEVVSGPAEALVTELLGRRAETVERVVAEVADGPVVEVGCGAGTATRRIAARPLVVVDRSLRAVLRATAGTDARPVVGLAEALPLADRSVATLVAANVVDLLEDPGAFLDEVTRVLRPGGRVVLTTPDPALGVVGGTDEALVDLLDDRGLRCVTDVDGLPWIRSHGPRHHQLYVVRLLVATLPATKRARGRAS